MNVNNDQETKNKLNQIEHDIADKIDEQFRIKVQSTLGHITGDDGAINTNGMWSLKNNLIPKHTIRKSTAIRDSKGNLITNPEAIKQYYLEEVLIRLRKRKIHPDIIQLQSLKEKLCEKRLKLAVHRKSNHWTMGHLEKVLRSLKTGRCRDPQGYVCDIFRTGGQDLKESLLNMCNLTKE